MISVHIGTMNQFWWDVRESLILNLKNRKRDEKWNESALVWISLKAEPKDLNANSYVEGGPQGAGERE